MKINYRIRRLLQPVGMLLAVIICLSAVSCGSTMTDGGAESEERITVTDALGRSVSVNKAPERVAALLGSFADVWCLAGGSICAAPRDAWEDFGLDREGVADLGGAHSPSLEALVASAPDLVIASAATASNVSMREPLEAMGISVIYFDVDSFEDYLRMLDVCTQITGHRELYEKNGLSLKARIDEIKALYSSADIPRGERRVLLLRVSAGMVKAKGSEGTILGEMLADMGCVNIADGNTALSEGLSVEAVIKEEPYHIFAVTMGNDAEGAKLTLENMLKEDPAWGRLSAVREGRVHIMDKRLFNMKPNARWSEAYEMLYETLTEK